MRAVMNKTGQILSCPKNAVVVTIEGEIFSLNERLPPFFLNYKYKHPRLSHPEEKDMNYIDFETSGRFTIYFSDDEIAKINCEKADDDFRREELLLAPNVSINLVFEIVAYLCYWDSDSKKAGVHYHEKLPKRYLKKLNKERYEVWAFCWDIDNVLHLIPRKLLKANDGWAST